MAVVGQKFPAVQAKNLTGLNVRLDQFWGRGEAVFLAIGFTYQSQYQINPWMQEIEHRYNIDGAERFYTLTMAVYQEVWTKLARGWIDGAMRRGSPATEHEHTLTTTDDALIRQSLEISDTQLAYFYLIDPGGTIRWAASGNKTPAAVERLEAAVATLTS